ncbi:glutamine amidotransferase-related protein, partial [Propioniciclava flava]
SSTTAVACSTASPRPSRPRATTPWRWDPQTVPDVVEVSAWTESGVIMAIRHRELPVESVQFHREWVLTEGGYQMLANWLAVCGITQYAPSGRGLAPLMAIPEV